MITAITMWLWCCVFKEEKVSGDNTREKEILQMLFIFSFSFAVILDVRIILAVK